MKDAWPKRLRRLLVPGSDRPLHAAVVIALATAGLAAFFLVSSASESAGWPVEQAKVVAMEEHGGLVDACGRRGGPAMDVTLRSADAPPDLDETFVLEGECYSDPKEIGDVWPVARVVEDDGDVVVYTFPTSVGEAWRQTLFASGIAFAATLFLLPTWTRARRRYGRPSHQRY